jgi:hypothetical protein
LINSTLILLLFRWRKHIYSFFKYHKVNYFKFSYSHWSKIIWLVLYTWPIKGYIQISFLEKRTVHITNPQIYNTLEFSHFNCIFILLIRTNFYWSVKYFRMCPYTFKGRYHIWKNRNSWPSLSFNFQLWEKAILFTNCLIQNYPNLELPTTSPHRFYIYDGVWIINNAVNWTEINVSNYPSIMHLSRL